MYAQLFTYRLLFWDPNAERFFVRIFFTIRSLLYIYKGKEMYFNVRWTNLPIFFLLFRNKIVITY